MKRKEDVLQVPEVFDVGVPGEDDLVSVVAFVGEPGLDDSFVAGGTNSAVAESEGIYDEETILDEVCI